MKETHRRFTCGLVLVLLVGVASFADDYQSAAAVRDLSRETVTDSIDAAYFNPAGTAFLDEGLHFQTMRLSKLQSYTHYSTLSETTYRGNNPTRLFPAARIGFNGGSWAVFFDYNTPDSFGPLRYEEGSSALDTWGGGSVFGTTAVMAFNLGGSLRVGDIFAVGASGRFVYGYIDFDVFYDAVGVAGQGLATGSGLGGMIGVDFIPFKGLTVAVVGEIGTNLTAEFTRVTGDQVAKAYLSTPPLAITVGAVRDSALPWRIRTGLSYELPFGLTVASTFKYAFYSIWNTNHRNTWSAGGSLSYDVSEKVEASLAGSYFTGKVIDQDLNNPLRPSLGGFAIAGGVGVEIGDGVVVDLGSVYERYLEETGSGANGFTDLNKQMLLISFGLTYTPGMP